MGFFQLGRPKEVECAVCGKSSLLVSEVLGLCVTCIRDRFKAAKPHLEAAHARVRDQYDLPPRPPDDQNGVHCGMCGNDCRIPDGSKGFCGIVENENGKLKRKFGTPERGLVNYYRDPLPTNCVSAWHCAGSSGAGYPKWCHSPRGDVGFNNLAVFLGSCTYNCLFCQNYSFRELTVKGKPTMSAEELGAEATNDVSCICYFGGDPASQMPFVIKSARIAHEAAERKGRILRFCLETNLSMSREMLEDFSEISLKSGGGIKADLKCWSSEVLYALSGIDHRVAFENFEFIGKKHAERPEVPFGRASTLLVPGYVDEREVGEIASFIAEIDPTIPYTLLAFHPHYFMRDMPRTKRSEAERFVETCKGEGLEEVRIGNPWLLT